MNTHRTIRGVTLFAALLLSTSLLTGCAQPRSAASGQPPRLEMVYPLQQDTDIVAFSYAATERLMDQVSEPLDPAKPILVASLANIDNLQQSSSLGRLISEQVGSRLSQLGHTVVEVKLRDTLAVNENGEFMLSRDIRKLSGAHDAQAVVTGTYAAGRRLVYVSLRLVRIVDAKIIASFDYSLPVGPNTQSLITSAAHPECGGKT